MFNKFKKTSFKPKTFGKSGGASHSKPGGGGFAKKKFGDRQEGENRGFGGESRGSGKPYGEKSYGERSFDSKKPYGDRPGGFGKKKFGDRQGGESRGFGKPYGDDRPYAPKKTYGNKPGGFGDRKFSDRREGESRGFGKPYGDDRPYAPKKTYGNKPGGFGDRKFSDRREGESRSFDRPYNDDRPYAPKKSYGDKPGGFGKSFGGGGFKGGKPAGKGGFKKFGKPNFGGSDRKPAFRSRFDDDRAERGGPAERQFDSDVRPSGEFRPRGERPERSFKPKFDREQSFRRTEFLRNRPGTFSREVNETYKGVGEGEAATAPWARSLMMTLEDTKTVPVRVVWVYDSMVAELPDGEPAAGDTVYVFDAQKRFLGSALYNPNSKIRARIFSLDKTIFHAAYIRESITKAVELRRKAGYLSQSCRVVFGEADGVPGLIVDKIGDYLVIQPLTFAVDKHLQIIVDHLNELICPQGIVVRNDVPVRIKEGLENKEVATFGEIPDVVKVREHDYVLYANLTSGQKTGIFLDQKLNRLSIVPFSKGARVLDLFCHVGGWAMCAASNGASKVIGVDSSKPALEMAERAARENGCDVAEFVEDDVFDFLRNYETSEDTLFDVIVCDPPAFAKTKAHFEDAMRAYLSLNYLAMKRLKPGGVLVSCSCSQAVHAGDFEEMLLTAARNARLQFQILERRGAPLDHPILLGLPETDYLKCFVLKRMD